MNARFAWFFACIAGALLAANGDARAQDSPAPLPPAKESAAAQQHFAQGEAAFSRGDFGMAAKSFEEAYAADPHPIALWNAARSWERAGEPVRAANQYRRFLDEAPADTANRDRATATLADLSRQLGRIEIVAPDAKSVEIDGNATRVRDQYVSPGAHLVRGTFEAGATTRQISVEPGRSVTVVLEPPAPVEPPKPKAIEPVVPKTVAPDKRGVTPWVFAGFAGATVVTAGVLVWSSIDTLLAWQDYEDMSVAEKKKNYGAGKYKQDRTNVLIGVTGGLAVTSGIVAVFATDWGSGTLIGLGPTEVTVVVAF